MPKRHLFNICLFLLTITIAMAGIACSGSQRDDDISSQISLLGFDKNNPLIIGIDADYAPLECIDDNGLPKGYDIEFTNALMKRLDIPYTYNPNTWKNIAPDVLHGKVDLAMMIYSPYRKDSTNYSRAVFRLYYQVVYPRKSNDERFDFRNLEGKRIAYMNSRPVGELLSSEGAERYSVSNLDEAMCDLVKGKYDAVICYRFQARYLIDLHNFTQLATDEISLPPREYCYVSHNPQLIEIIDRELLLMEKEGITDDIYKIKSTFGGLRIPTWVWYLLGSLVFLSLIIINTIYYKSRKEMAKANAILEERNRQLTLRNEELQEARERAMESDRMKSAFIQNITHQIRTPLNIVTGFAQVIYNEFEEISKSELRVMVKQMMKNTNTITTFINQLLALSLQQSQRTIPKNDTVNCSDFCHELAKGLVLEHAESVELMVESKVPSDLEIKTDKASLTNCLQELLNNANKFTVEGSITIGCYQTDDAHVCFAVSDTGPGIPDAERAKVFEQFYKVNEFSEGLGLGLTLSRNVAIMLGGDIRFDNTYTSGTRIIVTMPV